MENVIVTGPTGEIGLALVKELLSHDINVTALVRPHSKRTGRLPQHNHLRVIECEMENLKNCKIQDHFEVFYHLGWDYSRAHDRVDKHLLNAQYTLEAVELAVRMGCKCFVGAGSQAEYGRIGGKKTESTPCFPETAYGIAKYCAGRMAELSCKQKGIRYVWPRIFSVYGPGDAESTMVMSVIRQLMAGKIPALTKGEQMWDFMYSADAACALRLLGEKDNCEGIYCIAGGCKRQLRTYIEEIRDCIDRNLQLEFGKIPYAENQVMDLDVDISKLTKDTYFQPETSFEEGIRKTIQWCMEHPQVEITGYGE